MKPARLRLLLLIVALVLVLPALLAARKLNAHPTLFGNHRPPRYKLIDLGTLGGPLSYGSNSGTGLRILNDEGVVINTADTATPDPYAPLCLDADCLLAHARRWDHGENTDLGALPGVNSSFVSSINDRGWAAGFSQTGVIDPILGTIIHATLWRRHEIVDLGTLGNISIGVYINNAGQVVAISDTTVPDPFSIFGLPTEVHTFLWDNGKVQDIGTLGGSDTFAGAGCNNQRQDWVLGQSYVNFTPNPNTGIPTLDPYLWRHGTMTDLGTLGGTNGSAQCANNRGEVIGFSNLAGDIIAHGFVWKDGVMTDLGSLGGDRSEAQWINDVGEIAGSADLPGSTLHDATMWKNGVIHDLGTVDGDPCSRAYVINIWGQVVGGSSDCANFLHAFVWDKVNGILDLNKLIAPGSGLQLTNAININDRGEILAKSVANGVTPIDDEDLGHVVLLVPCIRHDEAGCGETGDDASDATPPNRGAVSPAAARARRPATARENIEAWRARLAKQYHIPSALQKNSR